MSGRPEAEIADFEEIVKIADLVAASTPRVAVVREVMTTLAEQVLSQAIQQDDVIIRSLQKLYRLQQAQDDHLGRTLNSRISAMEGRLLERIPIQPLTEQHAKA